MKRVEPSSPLKPSLQIHKSRLSYSLNNNNHNPSDNAAPSTIIDSIRDYSPRSLKRMSPSEEPLVSSHDDGQNQTMQNQQIHFSLSETQTGAGLQYNPQIFKKPKFSEESPTASSQRTGNGPATQCDTQIPSVHSQVNSDRIFEYMKNEVEYMPALDNVKFLIVFHIINDHSNLPYKSWIIDLRNCNPPLVSLCSVPGRIDQNYSTPNPPDLVITIRDKWFVSFVAGAPGLELFMKRRINFKGELKVALRLEQIFKSLPKPDWITNKINQNNLSEDHKNENKEINNEAQPSNKFF